MKSTLSENEVVVFTCGKHYASIMNNVFLVIIPSIFVIAYYLFPDYHPIKYKYYDYMEIGIWVLFIIFFFALLLAISRFRTEKFYITNKRVIYEEGVLSLSIRQNPIDKLGAINIERSFIGGLLNFGAVSFSTSSDYEIVTYNYVKNPLLFTEKLNEAHRNSK